MYNATPRRATLCVDLGGVVVSFAHMDTCNRVTRTFGVPARDVYARLFVPTIEGLFDRGLVAPIEFTNLCSAALGVTLNPAWFHSAWGDIFAPIEETIATLRDLRNQFDLILCSNTNLWHYEYARRVAPLDDLFDDFVLSFEVGSAKPEEAYYHAVLNRSTRSPPPIFVDDRIENLDAAHRMGFKTVLFTSAANLREQILGA